MTDHVQSADYVGPPYAFSSTSQTVLDWWTEWRAAEEAHNEALERVAPELAPWEGAKPAVIGAFGRWKFEGYIRDWKRDHPEGWKKAGRDGQWIVPKLSTKAGKALAARMAEVPPFTDPRRTNGGIPGVKIDIFFGQLPALGIYDDVAWMHFKDDWKDLDAIDMDLWSIRRMSEYYAAREHAQSGRSDER